MALERAPHAPRKAPRLRLSSYTLLLAAACSVPPRGASEAGIGKARDRSQLGARVYDQNCSGCHGKRGEGLGKTPALMGYGALPTYEPHESFTPAYSSPTPREPQPMTPPDHDERPPFRTARDLFEYASKRMPLPQNRAGSLRPEEYWAVINYILIAHGSPIPAEGVNEANAASIALEPKAR